MSVPVRIFSRSAARCGVPPGPVEAGVRPARVVAAALAVATALAVVVGFAPQLVLDLAAR